MFNPRFRTALLEDREEVVQIRGFRKNQPVPSNQPHAGMWSKSTAYALIPCSQPKRRTSACLQFNPRLKDGSSEVEVLVLGPPDAITSLLLSGPAFARARLKRSGNPDSAARLAPFRFTPRPSDEPTGPQIEPDTEHAVRHPESKIKP